MEDAQIEQMKERLNKDIAYVDRRVDTLQEALKSMGLDVERAQAPMLVQRLSRADGVAQVLINGADKPAIRVRLDPVRLAGEEDAQ